MEVPQFYTSSIIILTHITTQLPGDRLPAAVRERYHRLALADLKFDDVPISIDMLIGSDLYPHMLQSKADIIQNKGLLSSISTHLGWILIEALEESPTTTLVLLSVQVTPEIDGLL